MTTLVLEHHSSDLSLPDSAVYFKHLAYRPWFALYNVRLRPSGSPYKEVRIVRKPRTLLEKLARLIVQLVCYSACLCCVAWLLL
jgi:hypothetical protein